MNDIQLYINDQLVNLSDDSPIALTFQINDLAEVKNQQGNTSNQFKLPLTQRNRAILGFPDDVAFCNELPYTQYRARLVQDGLELMPYAKAELNSIEQDIANITLISGNVDFFDAIEGKLYDLGDSTTSYGIKKPFAPYDHEWTLDNVVASQRKTDGWIWPVVDYGKIESDPSKSIDVRYMRPGFFLKTAIDIIATNAGFKAKGSLLDDPIYNKLIVQFANDNFEHSTDWQNQPDLNSVSAQTTADQHCNTGGDRDGTVVFQKLVSGSTNVFQNNTFIAPEDMLININFHYGIKLRGTKKGDIGAKVFIRTNPNGQVVDAMTNDHAGEKSNDFTTFDKQSISTDLQVQKGQHVIIAYVLHSQQTEAYILSGSTLTITNNQKQVLYKQKVQCERIFPDISQKDLLKDTLQRFGIICQTDNTTKTINFASIRDIVKNIPKANDWTMKCLDQGKTVDFKLGNYAQVNNLKYKQDDNVLPNGFADSKINISDTTLPASVDLFESQFAPSLNKPWANGTIAVINKIDQSEAANTDFSITTQPRILIHDTITAKSITFTDGPNSRVLNNDTVCVPYFDKPNGTYSLKFESLRLRYYPELERILKNTKKVVRYFLLTPRDILELDLLIPVYLQQDGTYYYINKIDSWRKGQPTKVELVKLG